MDVAGTEAGDGNSTRGFYALASSGCPRAGACQHAQNGRFVQTETLIVSADPQHRLFGAEVFPFIERPGLATKLNLLQQLLDFANAAQDAGLSRKDFHRYERVD